MGQSASKAVTKIPKRPAALIQREKDQANFLQGQRSQVNLETPKTEADKNDGDMPGDLLQFLKEAGPVKQPKGTETKPRQTRMPKFLQEGKADIGTAVFQDKPQNPAATRDRESMRLMSSVEGFETMRSTNFSNKSESVDDREFDACDIVKFYGLLSQKYETNDSHSNIVEAFYKKENEKREVPWRKDDEQRHKQSLQHALTYLEVPVILLDESDNSLLGAKPGDLSNLEFFKIRRLPKTTVKLVVDDLYEMNKSN